MLLHRIATGVTCTAHATVGCRLTLRPRLIASVSGGRALHLSTPRRHVKQQQQQQHHPVLEAVNSISQKASDVSASASAVPVAALHHPGAAPSAPADPPPTAASTPAASVSLFTRVRGVLNHYTLGAKLLWHNFKHSRALHARVRAGGPPLTYPEYVQVQTARSDLHLGVPFVIFLALPAVGYLAPVFAILCPRYVPTTFATPAQVLAHVRADAFAARTAINSLRTVYSFHPHACGLEKLRAMLERIERGVGRVQKMDELYPLARLLCSLSPSLMAFPRSHLLLLHRTLTHAGFLPKYTYTRSMLARSLHRWRDRIWVGDQLLLQFGVEKLTEPELVRALYERGLYRQPIAMAAVLAREQADHLTALDKKPLKPQAPEDLRLRWAATSGGQFDPPLLPPPPSGALVHEWRTMLRDWAHLHARLQSETDAAVARFTQPLAEAEADRIAAFMQPGHHVTPSEAAQGAAGMPTHDAAAPDTDVKPPTAAMAYPVPGTSAATAAADNSDSVAASAAHVVVPAVAHADSKTKAPTFPLVFLAHVGPLCRIPSSAADLAAVQPTDKA